jgi:hypothetical protein
MMPSGKGALISTTQEKTQTHLISGVSKLVFELAEAVRSVLQALMSALQRRLTFGRQQRFIVLLRSVSGQNAAAGAHGAASEAG